MVKTSVKFEKNGNKTVGGVAHTRYILLLDFQFLGAWITSFAHTKSQFKIIFGKYYFVCEPTFKILWHFLLLLGCKTFCLEK